MFIADLPQSPPEDTEEVMNREWYRLFEERKAGTEEFCNSCLKLLGFPQSLHVEDPRRFQDGAEYSEYGFGQRCRNCPLPFTSA